MAGIVRKGMALVDTTPNCRSALTDRASCNPMRWVMVALSLPVLGYGLLNVLRPRTTMAWQIRATSRRNQQDPRRMVGESFQRWFGVDPDALPDAPLLRRVRLLGLAEVAFGVTLAVILFYLPW